MFFIELFSIRLDLIRTLIKPMESNKNLQLAFEFVQFTNKNIFLTGKAGTGKTTFLHQLKKISPKRMIVVAPTGVAAINAGGVTIHSFFQMPFGPHIPVENYDDTDPEIRPSRLNYQKFNRDKINIIKSLDLLVMDEISMVRADLLDGIDEVLRRYKNRNQPFGGVQLLMIGDLHQLAPIVKEDEWKILQEYYDTMYFFGSRALQKTDYISIELEHIYRQRDTDFIEILGKIRENRLDASSMQTLEKRYMPDFNPDAKEGYITLTTHNAQAQEINDLKLKRLKSARYNFTATVEGDFPEYAYPTDFELILKTDAQVMFVKNDLSQEKLYYNGRIGKITDIEEDVIYVKCPDDLKPIPVTPVEWQNSKYSIDDETKEISETIIGTFTQYPLKLAWAITIHKSQGLTFEKVIIDAHAAFAHGQVYVALSRCKTLDGLVLSTPLGQRAIKSDKQISEFTKEISDNPPDKHQLDVSKKDYQKFLLLELFDFKSQQMQILYLLKLLKTNKEVVFGNVREVVLQMNKKVQSDIIDVSDKFHNQLYELISNKPDITANNSLQERIKKACAYFTEKIVNNLLNHTENIQIETDNRAVRKALKDAVNRLNKEWQIKLACLQSCENGFSVKNYLDARAKAAIEKPAEKKSGKIEQEFSLDQIPHPELYKLLKTWRNLKAKELDIPHYMILPQKTMVAVTNILPDTESALKTIKGFGSKKIKKFGAEILEIVNNFAERNNLDRQLIKPLTPTPPKVKKPDTKQVSFELFKKGKTIEEIAKERGLTNSTIEGHLAHYAGTGEINIHQFVDDDKIKLITDYFVNSNNFLLGPAKEALGDSVSWTELRFVLKHLEFTGKISVNKS